VASTGSNVEGTRTYVPAAYRVLGTPTPDALLVYTPAEGQHVVRHRGKEGRQARKRSSGCVKGREGSGGGGGGARDGHSNWAPDSQAQVPPPLHPHAPAFELCRARLTIRREGNAPSTH
jgi:hypothetical protein